MFLYLFSVTKWPSYSEKPGTLALRNWQPLRNQTPWLAILDVVSWSEIQMGISLWWAARGLNCNSAHKTICPWEEQRTAVISCWCYNRSVYLGTGVEQEQMMFGQYLLPQPILPAHGEQFTWDCPLEPERLDRQPPWCHPTTDVVLRPGVVAVWSCGALRPPPGFRWLHLLGLARWGQAHTPRLPPELLVPHLHTGIILYVF